MDRVSPEKRSKIMSRIRSKDTGPEMIVRRLVHSLGFRYRLHRKDLPGNPDLVFPGRKKVIFVHGCFWHGHEECTKAIPPKSRQEYWIPKLAKNKQRDQERRSELLQLGWEIFTIWQCELKDMEDVKIKIIDFLEATPASR